MYFSFATSNRKSALRFLQTEYPEAEDTPVSIKTPLDFVEQDIIRITDPTMHPLSIIRGKKWENKYTPIIQKEIEYLENDIGRESAAE